MLATTVLKIATRIILPVFVLVGMGVVVDRTLRVDLTTLSRLCFRVLLPALVAVKLLETEIALGDVQLLVAASLLHLALMAVVGYVVFARAGSRNRRLVLTLGAVLANCGNYGIPLAELAFPGQGAGVLAVPLMVQNLLTFSLGIFLIERLRGGDRRPPVQVLLGILRMPVLHAIAAGAVLRASGVGLVPALDAPLHYLGGALVPMALLTLGVQLSRCRLTDSVRALSALTVVRLGISPLVAAGVVHLLRVPDPFGGIFIVAAGLPMAVNVFILAAEYELDSRLASQAILWTTLASAFTLSVLLAVLR